MNQRRDLKENLKKIFELNEITTHQNMWGTNNLVHAGKLKNWTKKRRKCQNNYLKKYPKEPEKNKLTQEQAYGGK